MLQFQWLSFYKNTIFFKIISNFLIIYLFELLLLIYFIKLLLFIYLIYLLFFVLNRTNEAERRRAAQILRLVQAGDRGSQHDRQARLLRLRLEGEVERLEGPGRAEQGGSDGQLRQRPSRHHQEDRRRPLQGGNARNEGKARVNHCC